MKKRLKAFKKFKVEHQDTQAQIQIQQAQSGENSNSGINNAEDEEVID
jgi:hypothetical protein